ncbi:MAG: methionine gamma-lyase family protein [Firmicutes bacterium]|nr:methionine gamma-lyase family protein [Bacillota bacterium]
MDIEKLISDCEKRLAPLFERAEDVAFFNQQKVLNAFKKNRIAPRHFEPSSGYAYDDQGRAELNAVFADAFNAEAAIVSPLFASGTHTITAALFGLLRPGNVCLSVSGKPYDTLLKVISGGDGSLKDFKIDFVYDNECFNSDCADFDYDKTKAAIKKHTPAVVYLQRSKGYNWRKSFNIAQIERLCAFVRKLTDAPIIVDNCYGEFVEKKEPLEVGADLIMGSLIKNPGGGLAPTGGYICGRQTLIDRVAGRYSAPGVGLEIGANPHGYKSYFQGFFMSPHVVLQAVKSALLFGEVFKTLGIDVLDESGFDIVRAIKLGSKERLIRFCEAIQGTSPIDAHVLPRPWAMPGYADKVIMAAGAFVLGASIELSADAPLHEPYIVYVQGALTYEHARIACAAAAERVSIRD